MNTTNHSEKTTADTQKLTKLLPSPLQLAQIAATVGPTDNPDAAVRNAMRLYLRALHFSQKHQNDSVADLALAVGDTTLLDQMCEELNEHAVQWPSELPKPDEFPATLKDFLCLIVKAKTPADGTARLRRFLREKGCHPSFWATNKPPTEAETGAANQIQAIKEGDEKGGYFTQDRWLAMASAYLNWWSDQKSAKARLSARERRS